VPVEVAGRAIGPRPRTHIQITNVQWLAGAIALLSLRGSRPRLESMSAINNACSIKGDVKEHFSPCTGGVDVFRDIQPLSPRRTLVWCRAPWFGLFHISGFIFLGCDDAGGF
jgi:hypothetical protein